MRGLDAIKRHLPSDVEDYVDEKIEMTNMIAPVACKGKIGRAYELCKAKVFISLNPTVIEGIVLGRWEGFLGEMGRR